MALVTADAIILQAFAYSETSRILRLLTSSHGMQSVIAKGARGPRNRFGGVLEPFTEGVVTYYARESRELQTLSGFELTRSRQALGNDLLRFGGASLIAEIVICATSESSHPGLFEQVIRSMHALETIAAADVEATVLTETWRLIASLGFAPELERCIECTRIVEADETVTFDHTAGGIRCTSCACGAAGRTIPPHARAALQAFARREPVTLPRSAGHWWLLSRYLDHHVLEGTRLRSLDFIATAIGDPRCEP